LKAFAVALSVKNLLLGLDRQDLSGQLRRAIDVILKQDGIRTADLGGKASTSEFADALVRRLQG
jgi:isocitrate dehydrogenase (NAD+)